MYMHMYMWNIDAYVGSTLGESLCGIAKHPQSRVGRFSAPGKNAESLARDACARVKEAREEEATRRSRRARSRGHVCADRRGTLAIPVGQSSSKLLLPL